MNYSSLRRRALAFTEEPFPWILGIAFVFSNIPRFYWIGIGLIVLSALWFSAWNIREVLSSRWALIVIGFFAAIALKDGVLWILGAGGFKAFAKSGSRVISLFGAAGILLAYQRKKGERLFGIALGLSAALIAAETFLVRRGLASLPLMSPNNFGMLFLWYPLYLVLRLREKGKGWAEFLAAAVGLAGLGILYYDGFKAYGDRTAPIAYALALIYLYIANPSARRAARPARPRWLLGIEVIGAAATISFLCLVYVPKIDAFLSHRQELWMAYSAKGAQRPLVGWGYTEEGDNLRLMSDMLRGKPIYGEFMATGLGAHNSFLAMFFENGAVFALAYVLLLLLRARKAGGRADIFDVSLVALIGLMSADVIAPGGISFFGFYLGVCLLSPLLNTTERA